VSVNGEFYAHSVYDSGCNGSGVYEDEDDEIHYVEYNLGRDWKRFKAAIGLKDNSDPGMHVLMEVYRDGQLAFSKVMTFGEITKVSVSVNNVLRLRLEIRAVDDGDGIFENGVPVYGKAHPASQAS
jgi:hypothetical protein